MMMGLGKRSAKRLYPDGNGDLGISEYLKRAEFIEDTGNM